MRWYNPGNPYSVAVAFLLLLLFSVGSAEAGTIGQGTAKIFNDNEVLAREQAERNALRNAVEKGVGLILESKTRVENYLVINDHIYSSAKGFVTNYRVVREERRGDVWHVEVDAEVSEAKLKSTLGHLRILHKKMGHKRFMVVYSPNHPQALDTSHGAAEAALASIQNELIREGFRLFDQRILADIVDRTTPAGNADKKKGDWIRIANSHQVDFIVEFELFPLDKSAISDSNFNLRAVWAEIRLKAYDVSTGLLICAIATEQKKLTTAREGSIAWEGDLTKAAKAAGAAIGRESILKIVDYYESVGDMGNSYLITLKDFDDNDTDIMLDILESLEGYQSLTERQTAPYVVVEYFSTLTRRRLYRLFKGECRKEGIRIDRKLEGNRWLITPVAK